MSPCEQYSGLQRQKLRFRPLVPALPSARPVILAPAYRLVHPDLLSISFCSTLRGRARTGRRLPHARIEPPGQQLGCLVEGLEPEMQKIGLAAMLEQGPLGQHQIGALGEAEVGAPVADHDDELARPAVRERAFAVARERRASGLGVRKRQPPAVAAAPLQVIGEIRNVDAVAVEHRADGAVETVGQHEQRVALAAERIDEAAKTGVDLDRPDEGIHLGGRRAHEIDLAHHALARADAAGLPVLLDVVPRRIGEPLQQQVRGIDRSNGSVEVQEDATLHTRYRHAYRTR